MLKQRVVTALLLVAVLLTVMLGLPPIATVWLLTALVLVGAWEWAGFIRPGLPTRATFTAVIALALAGALYLQSTEPAFLRVVLLVALAWWFAAFL